VGAASPVRIEHLDHYFGSGSLRRQILFDVSVEIGEGEIVIVTGPSGSGKTTLLTLIGALRSAQEGTVRVLGQELRGASARTLQRTRRHIGYIFQAHNLLDALTASENVQLSLQLQPGLKRPERTRRARDILQAVGLGEYVHQHPTRLSGGQRQRVAIARALAAEPRIILADEPTASLDKKSGRDVVDIIQRLARERGVTVLLVTHDSRILDVADRILHLEDGRIQSFVDAVMVNTQHMMGLLAASNRKGELVRRVAAMPMREFALLLERVTAESQKFLQAAASSSNDAFESMLEQALEAFTFKLGDILAAERASLFLVNREEKELWLKVAQEEGGRPVDLRVPITAGIAGHVATTGRTLRVDDAYAHPLFNPEVDRETGFRTRSILCVPIRDRGGQVFAVAQLLNRRDGEPWDASDESRFRDFLASIGVILETWWTMSQRRAPRT
jgi:putative ABC transport system ATP-binding protein